MKAEAFLDTGIFVAFFDRDDAHHPAAVELFEAFPRTAETSLLVFAETYNLLLHRYGEDCARRLRLMLATLPRLKLLPVDHAHHAAVERKLEAFRGQKLTYVDASSLVFLAQRKIKTVWGTDRALAIEGARLLPD